MSDTACNPCPQTKCYLSPHLLIGSRSDQTATHLGSLHCSLDESLRLHLLDKLTRIGQCSVTTLWDEHTLPLISEATIQDSRTGQLILDFEKVCLIGGERIRLA